MKRTIQTTLMLIFAITLTGSALTGCSSDNDDEVPEVFIGSEKDLLGYWLNDKCDAHDLMNQHGLVFRADSTFAKWFVTTENWSENEMGIWKKTDKGIMLIPCISDTGFGIISLTAQKLVFDTFSYWSALHTKTTYTKMEFGPIYVN